MKERNDERKKILASDKDWLCQPSMLIYIQAFEHCLHCFPSPSIYHRTKKKKEKKKDSLLLMYS